MDKYYVKICQRWGIEPLPFREEVQLSPERTMVRNEKCVIIDDIRNMRELLDVIERRVRASSEHENIADLLGEMREIVENAYGSIDRAARYGII